MNPDVDDLRRLVEKAVEDRGADRVAKEMDWKESTLRAFITRSGSRPRREGMRSLVKWASSAAAVVSRVAEAPAVPYGDPTTIPAHRWQEAAAGVVQRLQAVRRELEQVERLAALLMRSMPDATPVVPPHLAGNPLVAAALDDAPAPPREERRRRPASGAG
jgi:hypothetical protein